MEPAHLLGLGGAIGAVLRHAVDQWLDHSRFPVGTFVVNVVGTFILGLIVFAEIGGDFALFVGTGACGSFTTYSSFSVQTVRLWETGERLRATLYAGSTLGACLFAGGIAAGLVAIL